ncbi:MAG: helix-turn-helix transcriptional regulator [Pygmaiobacter massiliensis]|uniref:helix-turn-helix domain-containing protein n=1 Tax=Pygmaiobacter massiliensis TaxID=1917873 RepID=UPI000C7A2DE4|nr:helix-turn-helix transcriptional regulator [Pygmaiobacter massiliensis]MDD3203935.1 helix-turn-helix transcriptional regulator [Pygmaiobacter massiliensis]
MPAQWTGEIVGKMHGKITQNELAAYLKLHPKYVSAILNGKRSPANAEQTFRKAVDELIAARNID